MSGGKVDVKVVLLGKAYAGKTSLVERYIHNRFTGDTVPYQNTIGAAFAAKTVCVVGENVVVGIWDTAGSERYEAMSRIYYRGAKAAIICYDLTDRTSFDRARFWIGELQKHEANCQIHLCGTKYDLITENPAMRSINEGETKALGQDVRGRVYETSSKTGKDIGNEQYAALQRTFLAHVKVRVCGHGTINHQLTTSTDVLERGGCCIMEKDKIFIMIATDYVAARQKEPVDEIPEVVKLRRPFKKKGPCSSCS